MSYRPYRKVIAASGLDVFIDQEPNNLGAGQPWNNLFANFKPLQNSPNESWNMFNKTAFIDPDSSGFTLGTSGDAIQIDNYYFQHFGTGNTGNLIYQNMYADLGNGTDPISVGGLMYMRAAASIAAQTTIGPVQGYTFAPSFHASSTTSAGHYQNAFSDFSNMPIASGTYQSFNATPIIGSIKNNNNYTGVNLAATITSFTGNAGYTGVGISPNIGSFGTGFFQGIYVGPTVGSVVNATGIFVDMTNVSASGVKRAAELIGNVSITGSLSFTGALSIGQLSAYYGSNPVDGGGTPTSLHTLISAITGLNGVTVANADAIGVNTACLIELQANSINTSGPFKIGFSALGLPAVVKTATGSSVDYISGALFAISLDNTSTGGTIDNLNICRSTAVPNGITTVNNMRSFYADLPFGAVGSYYWGLYVEHDGDNFLKNSLKIGGTVGTTDRVTNSSVALEIESTTKAFVHARMTTTQRDALTAINGMEIYNTTTNKFQGYANGSWVDLH